MKVSESYQLDYYEIAYRKRKDSSFSRVWIDAQNKFFSPMLWSTTTTLFHLSVV